MLAPLFCLPIQANVCGTVCLNNSVLMSFIDVGQRNDLGTDNLFCPVLNGDRDASDSDPCGLELVSKLRTDTVLVSFRKMKIIAVMPPHRSYPQPPPTN